MAIFNSTQQKILVIVPMVLGTISLISSMTMIIMILKSKKKLTTSYRRLIFGLSWSCAIQSFGCMFSSIPVDSSSKMWGAMGNIHSCETQGFFLYIGTVSSALYNMSLCILFVCIINSWINPNSFSKKVEPFLHVFQFIFSSAWGVFLLRNEYFNPDMDSFICWLAPNPPTCEDAQCIRGEKAYSLRLYSIGLPLTFILFVILVSLGLISRKVKKQGKSSRKYHFGWKESNGSPSKSKKDSKRTNKLNGLQRITRLPVESDKEKAVLTQALVNLVVFLLSWIFPFLDAAIEYKGHQSLRFGLKLCAKTFYSLQGVFYILVYTRPHVISLRYLHAEYSWMKAVLIVIRSGGDNDGKLRTKRRLSRVSLQGIPSQDIPSQDIPSQNNSVESAV